MEEIIDWTAYFADLEAHSASLDARIKKARLESRTTDLASARNRYAIDQMEAEAAVLKEKISKGKANAPGQNKPPDPEPPPVEEPPVEPEPEPEPELPPGEDPEIPPGEEEPPEDPEVELPPPEEEPGFESQPQSSVLPQVHGCYREIVKWIKGLSEPDVTIPTDVVPEWDFTFPNNTWLANLWLTLRAQTNQNDHMPIAPTSDKRNQTSVFHGVAKDFTLAGLEDTEGFVSWPAEFNDAPRVRVARRIYPAAFWYIRSLPKGGTEGNPFRGNRALANRVLVTIGVTMEMTEYWYERRPKGAPFPEFQGSYQSPDSRFIGGFLNAWAYGYAACRDVLPPSTRRAFEAALKRFVAYLLGQNTGKNTPNMTTRAIPALVILHQAADDPALKNMARRAALNLTTGYPDGSLYDKWQRNSLIYPRAYVQEGFSPECFYQGESMYSFGEAYAHGEKAPEWQWIGEPLRDMTAFRTHQLFPQVGGTPIGPSAYAGRTGSGYEGLQASAPWRDTSFAAWHEEALPVHDLWAAKDLATPAKMLAGLKNTFTQGKLWAGTTNRWAAISTQRVAEYAMDHDHSWPGYVVYHPADPDWYDRIWPLIESGHPKTKIPYDMSGYYWHRQFGPDFTGRKASDGSQDFGYFIEHCADGGTYGGYRGGSLQAFWTRSTGPIILGRKNKSNNERIWSEIQVWPTHMVAGRGSKGLWSSAVQQKRTVDIVDEGPVSVSGLMDGTGQNGQQAPVNTDVEMTFTPLEKGLHILHVLLRTSGESEAWVHLGNVRAAALIEFATSSGFQQLGTNYVEARFVRLSLHGGSVLLVLDNPTRVRLSPHEWVQNFHGTVRLRGIHFDLKPTGSVGFEMVTRQ